MINNEDMKEAHRIDKLVLMTEKLREQLGYTDTCWVADGYHTIEHWTVDLNVEKKDE